MKYAVDFLALKSTTAEDKRIAKVMSNWRSAYAALAELKDSEKNLETIGLMIRWELHNLDGPRLHLLTRLHMRLNRMRGRVEFATLEKYAERN